MVKLKYETDVLISELRQVFFTQSTCRFVWQVKGKKKVSKFLRDEKINVISKASIWLLTDAKDQIIWVVGHRADRRFASKLNTDKSLCFRIL